MIPRLPAPVDANLSSHDTLFHYRFEITEVVSFYSSAALKNACAADRVAISGLKKKLVLDIARSGKRIVGGRMWKDFCFFEKRNGFFS